MLLSGQFKLGKDKLGDIEPNLSCKGKNLGKFQGMLFQVSLV